MNNKELARYIDLTLLKPEATTRQIDELCQMAIKCGVYGVCVNSSRLRQVVRNLRDTGIVPVCVVGFPLGASLNEILKFETMAAHAHGAGEIDMVIDLGAARDRRYDGVRRGIEAVVEYAGGLPVKAIIESAALDETDVVLVSRFAVTAGAKFIKTSTGFHPAGGATLRAVELIREGIGETTGVGIKASGGIKTREQALAFIEAGATRLGVSDVSNILTEEAP
jgi:deoxyribose-phosphate aldolase